jgi:adenine-specific DNA methylase
MVLNDKIKELIFKIITKHSVGASFYKYCNNLWLIKPNEKEWIFELTSNGVLWYNYYFFNKSYKYMSLENEMLKNEHHITEWVKQYINNSLIKIDETTTGSDKSLFLNTIIKSAELITNTSDWYHSYPYRIEEIKELPDKSGELGGYSEYYALQKDRTYTHIETVNDVIRDGILKTNWRKVDNHPTYVDTIIGE